ncbi:hypothetical protein Golomagni_01422, partial [Golovinomyces magnicellulatus]
LKTTEFVPWTETKVNDATASDIKNYINERIAEYEDKNLYGNSTKNLRNFVRKRKVFIQKSRGQSNPTVFVSAASDQWCSMPDNIINEVVEIYRPFNKLPVSRDLKASQNYPASFNNPILTLMKAYKEEQKYARIPSQSFNLKFKIFTEFFNTIDISINQHFLSHFQNVDEMARQTIVTELYSTSLLQRAQNDEMRKNLTSYKHEKVQISAVIQELRRDLSNSHDKNAELL